MHWLRGLLKRIRALAQPASAEHDLDDEIAFHIEHETAKNIALGLAPDEAHRRALVAFGGVSQTHEAHRDVRAVGWIADLFADARFALRSLSRAPVLAGAAILTLALGIGATTAIYTVVNAVLLRPLPFEKPGRLYMIGEDNAERDWHLQDAAPANYLDWQEQVPAFEQMAGYADGGFTATLTGSGEPRIVRFSQVTGGFFDILGVRAQRGRMFRESETWKQPVNVAVISDGFWRTVLGSDPNVVGRTIRLDGNVVQVVGVAPPGFAYPTANVDLWQPVAWDPAIRSKIFFRRAHWLRSIARVRDGVPEATANAQLQAVVARLQQQYPVTNTAMGAEMKPLHEFLTGSAKRPLVVLLAAVGLLLLIACANVGNLLLVHAAGRQRELALRLALGAGRTRITRQLLTESVILSLLGGAAGLALGWGSVQVLTAMQPKGMLPVHDVGIDWRVLLFVLVIATASGILFGIAPSLWGQRQPPASALGDGGRSSSVGQRMRRWGDLLVVGEVALALLLTVGAGLLVRSFRELQRIDLGFDASGVLAASLQVGGGRYDSVATLLPFEANLVERARAIPGVESAALTSSVPLTGPGWTSDFAIAGRPRDDYATEVAHREVSPQYFHAMRVPIVRGRAFTEADTRDVDRVVVVNESLVKRYFAGQDPIGRRICFDRVPDSTSVWRTIVGVVGNERLVAVATEPRDEIIAPLAQDPQQGISLVVRTAGDPLAMAAPVRGIVRDLDPNLAVESMRTMSSVRADSLARDRFLMTMLIVFACVGLALAIVGVYGVLAQVTRRRTREMGIRIALGARGTEVRWLVVSQGLRLVAAGLVIGSVLALVVTRAMQRVLYHVPPSDPLTYVVVGMMLAATGMAAAWLPAHRASRTDPSLALRAE
jgi:putative ABC transport system permease protein